MRLLDLLNEDSTVDEIKNELMDILLTYKSKNQKSIPMSGQDGLITMLKKVGYDIKTPQIMDTLSGNEFKNVVKRSSTGKVELKTTEPDTEVNKSELKKSQDKVAKIAAKASMKAVQSGELK
jgi:uncharacterized membrane protein YkoI